MKALLAMLLVTGCAASAQAPVEPPVSCDDRQSIVDALNQRYNEVPVSIGVTVGGALFEIYASPGGETWTALVSPNVNRACILAVGHNWRGLPPDPGTST